jgi:hypothetical protein
MTDEQMLSVYRHDAHKMRGRSHDAGSRKLAGVIVNQDVPYGADSDAAALSRPSGKPQAQLENEQTHYRMSMLTGDTAYDPDSFSLQRRESELTSLLATEDAEAAHKAWLSSETVAAFNEAVAYPYTSLKYHTLLVAALVDCYRNGNGFSDLYLVVDDPTEVVPHRTVYSGPDFTLRIAPKPADACANVPARPYRSWGSTWSRLTEIPLDTANSKWEMTLDANLRRITAWSTALQYIEDFQQSDAMQPAGPMAPTGGEP